MRTINEDIKKNSFQKVYLIYGEEGYLKQQYKNKIRQAVCGDDTMNYSYFEGKGIRVEDVISIADTMPFFAEKRLVTIENSEFFKSANDKMTEYVEHLPDTLILVFVEEEVDKRNKLFKKVKEFGYVSEMTGQTPATLSKWVAGLIGKEGKKITRQTLDYFLAAAGTDMNHISTELEKLLSYVGTREEITVEDINEVCSVLTVAKIFDMVDAMGNKNRSKTFSCYYDMVEVKEPPMRILYMLSRQFRIILQTKELAAKGVSSKEIATKLALAPFVVNKALKQAEKFKTKDIKKALEDCLLVEEDVKNGKMEDKIGVELILTAYSK